MKRAVALFALIVAVIPAASNAAWDPNGNPVVIAPETQDRFAAIPFGSGGILVAWVDQRAGDPGDIYAMALDASGEPAAGWPAGGVPICRAPGVQAYVSLISDEAGGAYVHWIDERTGNPAHALQRITSTGEVAAGWPVNGLIFGSGFPAFAQYALAPDGQGGVYVAWDDGNPLRARAARYDGTGVIAPGWPVDLPMANAIPPRFDMIADGAGGVVALGLATDREVAVRLSGDGSVSPGWPASGLVLFPQSMGETRLVAGQANDFFAIYVPPMVALDAPPMTPQCVGCFPQGIRATHVGLDGLVDPAWPFLTGEYAGFQGEVAADGRGGILSVGVPEVRPEYGLAAPGRAMRLGADKSQPWGATTPVCNQPTQETASIAPDGSGGAFVAWLDVRLSTPVLYATRLDGAGKFAPGWPPSGSMEALAAVHPSAPRVVATQPGTAVVVWVDSRNGTADIYARQMVPGPAGPPTGGVVGPGTPFGIVLVAPNPARGPVTVIVNLTGASDGQLEVIDVTGRVHERRALPAGPSSVTLDWAAKAPPGAYWLRLTQGASVSTRRLMIVR